VYRKFDKIFCVSPSVCVRFLKDFPELGNIVESYKNLLLPQQIQKLSEETVTEKIDSKVVNIATVGRVSKEKGQEMIPSVIKMLQDRGVKVFWYIVGDGDDLDRIKEISCEYGVADSICFVGSKSNPYPYMKMCDIYVQPSYTEGYCLTVCEAAILGKPIVLTEIAAAEILENGKTAIVVKPNINSITDGIEKLIFQPEIKRNLIKNLAELDLSNSQEIDKLLRII
jgi:glycosyltransferase involved in cell wall biosynthesis